MAFAIWRPNRDDGFMAVSDQKDTKLLHLRRRVHQVLDVPQADDWISKIVGYALVILIILNVLAVILESVTAIREAFGDAFIWFEIVSVAIFTAEYVLRLWGSIEDANQRYQDPLLGRLRYAMRPLVLIDLIVILPFYLSVLFGFDLRFLRVMRLLRVLKLTRYSGALAMFGAVISSQKRPLLMAAYLLAITLVLVASLMYLVENEAQPVAFADIPSAMWWGLVTLTTVGYGDVTPITPVGKLLGAAVTIMGIGMYALPAGILASGFMQELNRRQFMVTWRMVAKVPLFARLEAERIAEIAAQLDTQVVPPRYTIVRRGEPAECMYFISSGDVEVELEPAPLRLTTGDFFGEIALIRRQPRTATIVSLTECHLLVLEARNLEKVLADNPEMAEDMQRVIEKRAGDSEEFVFSADMKKTNDRDAV